jgi:hypothetical protein
MCRAEHPFGCRRGVIEDSFRESAEEIEAPAVCNADFSSKSQQCLVYFNRCRQQLTLIYEPSHIPADLGYCILPAHEQCTYSFYLETNHVCSRRLLWSFHFGALTPTVPRISSSIHPGNHLADLLRLFATPRLLNVRTTMITTAELNIMTCR